MAASSISTRPLFSGPKTSKTLGLDENTLTVNGRLAHGHDNAPFSMTKVHLVAKKRIWPKTIAESSTDMEGRYTFKASSDYDSVPLALQVFEPFNKSDPDSELVMIAEIPLEIKRGVTLKGQSSKEVILTAHDAKANYLEADPTNDLGLVEQPQDGSKKVESVDLKFLKGIIEPVLYAETKKLLNACSSSEEIQKAFDPKYKLSLCESNVIEMMLNGIPESILREAADGRYVHVINWDRYMKDEENKKSSDLPNIEAYYKKNEKGEFIFDEIAVQQLGQERKVYNQTSPAWKRALYLYSSMMLIYGEAKRHLGYEHLILGAYARGVKRNCSPENPMLKIVGPQTAQTLPINEAGAGVIFGNEGVIGKSRLSTEGVDLMLKDTQAANSWKGFFPGGSLTTDDNHWLATIKQEAFKNLKDQIAAHVGEHKNDFIKYKPEIYRTGLDIAQNSPEYRPFEVENAHFGPIAKEQQSEIDLSGTEGRYKYKDKYRAQHLITDSPMTPKNEEEEAQYLENVIEFLTVVQYLNFNHSLTHGYQKIWATNLNFASIGPKLGDIDAEGEKDEEGYLKVASCGGTLPNVSKAQHGIVHVLVKAVRTLLLDSETTHPIVKNAIHKTLPIFIKYGVNVQVLQSISI